MIEKWATKIDENDLITTTKHTKQTKRNNSKFWLISLSRMNASEISHAVPRSIVVILVFTHFNFAGFAAATKLEPSWCWWRRRRSFKDNDAFLGRSNQSTCLLLWALCPFRQFLPRTGIWPNQLATYVVSFFQSQLAISWKFPRKIGLTLDWSSVGNWTGKH